MANVQPSLARNIPLTSPVYAPESCLDTSCAPYVSFNLSPSTSVCTLRRSVNGGMTVTSTLSKYFSGNENAIFCTRAMASKWLRFIFQLPAISGLRATGLLGFFSDYGGGRDYFRTARALRCREASCPQGIPATPHLRSKCGRNRPRQGRVGAPPQRSRRHPPR